MTLKNSSLAAGVFGFLKVVFNFYDVFFITFNSFLNTFVNNFIINSKKSLTSFLSS